MVISGKKMKIVGSDFNEGKKGTMINDTVYSYFWSESKYKMDCSRRNIFDSEFVPPSEVKFIDPGELNTMTPEELQKLYPTQE